SFPSRSRRSGYSHTSRHSRRAAAGRNSQPPHAPAQRRRPRPPAVVTGTSSVSPAGARLWRGPGVLGVEVEPDGLVGMEEGGKPSVALVQEFAAAGVGGSVGFVLSSRAEEAEHGSTPFVRRTGHRRWAGLR